MKKTERLGMRVSPQDKKRWEQEAKRAGYDSLAAWITDTLNIASTLNPSLQKTLTKHR